MPANFVAMSLKSFVSGLKGAGFGRPNPLSRADLKHANFSFSQFGEDLALLRYFEERRGFYVDIGAHHPVRFSNTYLLYQRGWSGINVDANADALDLFRSRRPRDVNLHAAVSDIVQEVEFSVYEESALSRIAGQSGAGAETAGGIAPPIKKIIL